MKQQPFIHEVYGFDQQRAMQYGYTMQHLCLLRWFLSFQSSGKMKEFISERGEEKKSYFWVSYKKPQFEYPMLGCLRSIRRYFDDLCGLDPRINKVANLPFPLEKHTELTKKGKYTYFRSMPEAIAYLQRHDANPEQIKPEPKESDMSTMAETLIPQTMITNHHPATAKKRATHAVTELRPKTRKILALLLEQGTPFSHRLNKPGERVSKTLLCIEKKLQSLYAGTFLEEYPFDELWQRGKDLSVFDKMKGNWQNIIDCLIEAANKYKKWEDQKTKSIDSWLYNPRTCKSTFLTAISMSRPDQDFAAEKVLDQIAQNDPKSANVIAQLLDERHGWGNTYMCVESLKTVLQYLNQNWYSIQANNKELWHYHKPAEILSNYGRFLLLQKAPNPKHMNITGYLWMAFTEHFYHETEIDLEITA